ncbi:MAG: tRNA uridine-5-carboxymethylaminomethyl(34) synthesis GTPase MnmE [Kiritimatiellae bacterium]|nr:tRNA uridine-5-carboxymethylaminomethyl(34) synthesis GTPase MnmE [Kiritimatiellia bacterium]
MNTNIDTIAALCTAPGKAAISIVRVSGPGAFDVADAVFRGSGPKPSERTAGTFLHGFVHGADTIVDSEGQDLDEVILLLYRAPQSYTREDVVELQGHGGQAAARRILAAVLEAGARLAGPGEFTRRAFLNGRIDLVQAEAVMDLINAQSNRAANCAIDQLEGHLSSYIGDTYNKILSTAADLEAVLDFDDGELPTPILPEIMERLKSSMVSINAVLKTWEEGRLLREGAVVVIAGRPNVGKSSLLNRLLGSDRAIVTDVPGTTRDTVEETLIVHGVPMRLVDTAGLRDTDCRIEQEGITRTQGMLSRADLTLYLVDAAMGPVDDDIQQLEACDNSTTVLVANKCDLAANLLELRTGTWEIEAQVSAATGQGIERLTELMAERLGVSADDATGIYISERHRMGLLNAKKHCEAAIEQLGSEDEGLIVTAATELRSALEGLGEIIGKRYDTALLDRIFSRFCIGK